MAIVIYYSIYILMLVQKEKILKDVIYQLTLERTNLTLTLLFILF